MRRLEMQWLWSALWWIAFVSSCIWIAVGFFWSWLNSGRKEGLTVTSGISWAFALGWLAKILYSTAPTLMREWAVFLLLIGVAIYALNYDQ